MPSAWQQSKRDRVSLLLHERMKKNFKIAISTLPYCMLWLSTNPFSKSYLRKYHWFVCCHYSSHRHVLNSMPQSDGVNTKAHSWSSRQTQHPLLYKRRKWRPVLVGNGKKDLFISLLEYHKNTVQHNLDKCIHLGEWFKILIRAQSWDSSYYSYFCSQSDLCRLK